MRGVHARLGRARRCVSRPRAAARRQSGAQRPQSRREPLHRTSAWKIHLRMERRSERRAEYLAAESKLGKARITDYFAWRPTDHGRFGVARRTCARAVARVSARSL